MLKIFLLSFALLFVFGVVAAQEETKEVIDVTEELSLDEDVQPEDLGVSDPRILPDSPFYFLKNWGRGIQSFFAFSPVAKAELRLKFANEKLIEAKKLTEIKKDPEIIKKGLENYQAETRRIKLAADKIKEKAADNPRVNAFLDKFTKYQILHHRILQKLETQVPPEVFEKIKEVREEQIERFAGVMTKLEDRKEKLIERLEKNLEEIRGSEFKHFKNLEVLKELEEKVPEEAKEAIRKARENSLKRLQGNLEQMSSAGQERFKEYLNRISGDKERHLEILENLRLEIGKAPETPQVLRLKEKLEEGKIEIIKRIGVKLKELDCPLWTPPAPGFCKEGRVIIDKNLETGCPLPPRCIVPGETVAPRTSIVKPGERVCVALWEPVCGQDGKTYSNKCFAGLAGAEIDYAGICKTKEAESPLQLKQQLKEIAPQISP